MSIHDYTERESKIGFLLRRLCNQFFSFACALCTHNGRSLQEKNWCSLLAKFPTFESRSVYLKRSFDIFVSCCVLLAGLPLFLVIAIIIKCTSQGPIFYCSMRLGRDGKHFKFWKFRSMYKDASQKLSELLKSDPKLQKEWNIYFKLKNDPRITPFGKFLRKTSLDEFPQFWNVLKGELSVVGPRPYLPNELPYIKKIAGTNVRKMLSVRPGLTGIWQTSGRSYLTFEQRVQLDLDYIGSRSFLFDLQLIAKTIPVLIFPKGAF